MTRTTTLPRGVTRHGNGYRGRAHGFPPASFPRVDEADDYVRECRRRRRDGILVPPSRRELQTESAILRFVSPLVPGAAAWCVRS